MNKLKFFDEVFKLLLALVACAWGIYVLLALFASDVDGCAVGSTWLLSGSAIAAGILSVLPIIYGLIRLLFWPNSSSGVKTTATGWILSCVVAIFTSLVILLVLMISRYGC